LKCIHIPSLKSKAEYDVIKNNCFKMTSYGRSLKKAVSIKTSQFQVRVCCKKQLNFLFVFKWEHFEQTFSLIGLIHLTF